MAHIFQDDFTKWLKQMGYTNKISKEQLNALASLPVRSLWRHILLHVRTPEEVKLVRENLLLNELKTTENSKLSMVLCSVNDFENYNKMKTKEKHLEKLKKEEVDLVNSIKKLAYTKRQKQCELQHEKEKLSEQNLKHKMFKIKKDLICHEMQKLPEVNNILKELQVTHEEVSQEQYKENKTNFTHCIALIKEYIEMKLLKQCSEEELNAKYKRVCDFIDNKLRAMPPARICNEFINLMTLSRDSLSANLPDVEEMIDGTRVGSNLNNLWKKHCDLSLEERKFNEDLNKTNIDLEECQKELINEIKMNLNIRENDIESIKTISDFISLTSKFTSIEEMLIELKDSCDDMFEINKRDNSLEYDLLKSKLIQVSSDVVEKSKFVIKCKTHLCKQKDRLSNNVDHIYVQVLQSLDSHFNMVFKNPAQFQEGIAKDFELCVKVPISVMNRSWDSLYYLDYECKQKLISSPMSRIVLRSEETCFQYLLKVIHWMEILKQKLDLEQSTQINTICVRKYDIQKETPNLTESVENALKMLKSIVQFWKKQPLTYNIPDDLIIHGEMYSTWKIRKGNE